MTSELKGKGVARLLGLSLGASKSSIWLLAFLLAAPAFAGELLHTRRGVISTKERMQNMNFTKEATEYVIQSKKVISRAFQQKLKSHGMVVLKYLPEDAFIVTGDRQAILAARFWPEVQGVLPYSVAMKISPDLNPLSVFSAQKTEKVVVQLFAGSDLSSVQNFIENSLQGEVLYLGDAAIVASLKQKDILSLAKEVKGIEQIEPYVPMQTFSFAPQIDDGAEWAAGNSVMAGDYSDLSGNEDGTNVMKFSAAWASGYAGRNQIVAMADTGLDSGDVATIHPDLVGSVVSGYAYGMFSKSWSDPMGHGTHVAGSILGKGNLSNGKIKGGAYDSKMVAQGMWSPVLENLTVPPKLGSLFAQALTDGAKIHSNSWGSARNFGAYDSYAMQVDEFVFQNPEFLPIFAAGNSGMDKNRDGRIDSGSVSSPGTAKNALTVGASENVLSKGGIQVPVGKLRGGSEVWGVEPIKSDLISNSENGVAMFSSRGPTLDGRVKPDIVAPGTNILSLKSQVEGASDLWGAYNTYYAFSGGTSMATPLVAGAAAIAREVLENKYKVENPTAALLKATLLHTAFDIYPGQFGEVGEAKGQEILTLRPTHDAGYGRVDVTEIVDADLTLVDEKDGVGQGEEFEKKFLVNKKGTLVFTLVYSDAPAALTASKALVNDLDLVVYDANNKEVQKADRINNTEMIELTDYPLGQYSVKVRGVNVPQGKNGKQPFALVVSVK